MPYHITNIKWDLDPQDEHIRASLPTETIIHGNLSPDELADHLSDKYGWCITSLSYNVIKPEQPSIEDTIELVNDLDGYGLISTDDTLLIERLEALGYQWNDPEQRHRYFGQDEDE